jgi:hypothetical protein
MSGIEGVTCCNAIIMDLIAASAPSEKQAEKIFLRSPNPIKKQDISLFITEGK